MTKGRDTTTEERMEIVKTCIANGNDYGGTALKYRVSCRQVYTWTREYLEMGVAAGLEDRQGHRDAAEPDAGGRTERQDRPA